MRLWPGLALGLVASTSVPPVHSDLLSSDLLNLRGGLRSPSAQLLSTKQRPCTSSKPQPSSFFSTALQALKCQGMGSDARADAAGSLRAAADRQAMCVAENATPAAEKAVEVGQVRCAVWNSDEHAESLLRICHLSWDYLPRMIEKFHESIEDHPRVLSRREPGVSAQSFRPIQRCEGIKNARVLSVGVRRARTRS